MHVPAFVINTTSKMSLNVCNASRMRRVWYTHTRLALVSLLIKRSQRGEVALPMVKLYSLITRCKGYAGAKT